MKAVRHPIEYSLVVLTMWIARVLPWSAVRAMGSGLGFLFYAFDRRHRRIALQNLAAAFPRKPEAERQALAKEVFGHFGRLLFELLKFSGLSREEVLDRVEIEGGDRIRDAHGRGGGALLFTGHFGYWEINAIAHAAAFAPIGVLARPLDNRRLHDLLERMRGCQGNYAIYRRGALRRVLKALHANDAVAILIDQHIQAPDAVTVSFFDRPAATTLALGVLALRTGAPVIPVFALPNGVGRYRLVYERPVDPPADDSPEAIRDFTQRCTDVLEMQVRRRPELWLWMHRRWRDSAVIEAGDAGMFPPAAADEERDPSGDDA
jgi:Kdo2-lipid IVA lauroyltransferase/acyltransferase